MDQIPSDIRIVILAAGGATRMKPLSDEVTKPMLPVLGIPLIQQILENFYTIGGRNFVVVYGDAEHQILPLLKECRQEYPDIIIKDVRQPEPMGMADAIEYTQSKVYPNDDISYPFFVSAGDVLFPPEDLLRTFQIHESSGAAITLPAVYSEDPAMADSYGNMDIQENLVLQIVEKPGAENRVGNFYSMPIYLFRADIYDMIHQIGYSMRGEKELQDAIQLIIDQKKVVAGVQLLETKIVRPYDGEYHITYPHDFLLMNLHLLGMIKNELGAQLGISPGSAEMLEPNPQVVESFIENNVMMGDNINLRKSYVFHDAVIENDAQIILSIIGPGVTITTGRNIIKKLVLISGEYDLEIPN